jgi:hypothetical protein
MPSSALDGAEQEEIGRMRVPPDVRSGPDDAHSQVRYWTPDPWSASTGPRAARPEHFYYLDTDVDGSTC